jgi:type II secretory pathway pseudopilin PulG
VKFQGVRPAASLIEVFVVLAIIALLAGILMPAVLRARESASYITCRHHLRQIGFAIHQYEVAYGYFPGIGTSPHQDSVLTRLLPYFEQTNLQQSIAADKPLFIDVGDYCWIHVSQQEPARTVIPLLICPSESQAPLFADRNSEYGQATLAGTNYNFNAGTGTGTYYDFRYPTDGLFWYGSKIRHKDITDGLSSTMFVSEALMGTGVDVYTPAAADTRRHWMSMACTAVPNPDHPGTIPPLTDDLSPSRNGERHFPQCRDS